MRWRSRLLAVVGALVLLSGAGYYGARQWRGKNVSRVQRGYEVAYRNGCFSCHGPGGIKGMANPGHAEEEVPPWSGGLMTMYAFNEGELREWILDGLPARIRNDPEQMKLRAKAVVEMPAWRGIINERDLDDLVAYVKAVGDFEKPQDEKADEGRKVAERLGCFNCHGPQGRGSTPNARAFKGYIPSWDGPDFPELARDDGEIREWVLDGVSKRMSNNPGARFFLERQPIKMPAYRGNIKDEEIGRIIDYIHWLRQHPY
jgi:mono/diheme cytochrome c family protein